MGKPLLAQASASDDVLVRPATSADMPRVINQWLPSFRDSKWAGVIPNNLYKAVYAEAIRQLLARGSRVAVACDPQKPELLIGFICWELSPRDKILHYVFVRDLYRRNGIAHQLMRFVGIAKGDAFVYTFRTPDSRYVAGTAGIHLPALARRSYAYKESSGEVVNP